MNQTIEFLDAIDNVYNREIPDDVLSRARQSLLDYIAVTCAGAEFQKSKLERYLEFAEPENGNYKAIGLNMNLAMNEAVFLNGLNGHALDFDDGTNSGIIHLGSPIFSLLLPLAQKYKKTVDEVLRAAIVGYETSYTMAISIQPGHKALGYHATGTCGTLGTVIAASYMLNFTKEERFQAFASASVAASGMLKVLDDGSELKPYNVAKTALLALTALRMSKAGFKGHADPLGGRGFLKMMTGRDDIQLKPVLQNGTYAIMKTYTKPYASCRYTHPSVEAAINLRNKFNLKPADIERIDIKTYDLAVAGHDHTYIPGSYSAKLSTPYAVAAGLIYGRAGLQEFSEDMVKNEEILELTKKVHVKPDEQLSREFPDIQAAIETITAKSGTFTERVDFPKGEPENPLTESEFKCRYDMLMMYSGISSNIADSVYEMITQYTVAADEILKNI